MEFLLVHKASDDSSKPNKYRSKVMLLPVVHLFFGSDVNDAGQSPSVRRFLADEIVESTSLVGGMRVLYRDSSDELERFVEFSTLFPEVRYVVRSAIADEELADEAWSIIHDGACRYIYGIEAVLAMLAASEPWLREYPLKQIRPSFQTAGGEASVGLKRQLAATTTTF